MAIAADRLGPSVDQYVITPNDSADLPSIPLAILVTGAGNARMKGANSATYVDYVGLTVGQILPIMVSRVYATNTTATLVALA